MQKREKTNIFKLELSDNKHEVAYLKLPTYPLQGIGRVSKSFRLFDVMGKYNGPDIVFDFDQEGVLVGMEIITDNFDGDEDI